MAIFLAVAHLILTISDKDDANPIDRFLYKAGKAIVPFHIGASRRDFWVPVIEKLVFSLGDQQLLTGLTMQIAAFVTRCTISLYHFTLVNDLAWFSATVHLVTLRVLEDYFFDNHVQRDWRVALMVTMALLLATSTVVKGHHLWYDGWPYDAQCLFAELFGNIDGFSVFWMIVNLALICLAYSLTIIPLYYRPTAFVKYWLETEPKAAMDRGVVTWIYVAWLTFIGSRTMHFVLNIF